MGSFLIIEYTATMDPDDFTKTYSKTNYTKEEILSILENSSYNVIPILKCNVESTDESMSGVFFNIVDFPHKYFNNNNEQESTEYTFVFNEPLNNSLFTIDNEGNLVSLND